jgi:SprT-like family
MAAQKVASSHPLSKLSILCVVFLSYFVGAHAYVPLAKQTSLPGIQGQLQEEYAADNAKYFGGQLPPAVIRFAEIPPDDEGNYFLGTSGRGLFGAFEIVLDPRFNVAGQTSHATMMHEECHLYSWEKTGEFDSGHGTEFQKCEQKLQDEGALKEIF